MLYCVRPVLTMQQGVQPLGQRSVSNWRWTLSLLLLARGSATPPLHGGGTTQKSGCLMTKTMMISRLSNMRMGTKTIPGITLQAPQMTASEAWRSACALTTVAVFLLPQQMLVVDFALQWQRLPADIAA